MFSLWRIKNTLIVVLSSWLLTACGLNTRSPHELFTSCIMDPVPSSVRDLQAVYEGQHEWAAYFHFHVSEADLDKIAMALDAGEVGWSHFKVALDNFTNAPSQFHPPQDWFKHCRLYQGITVKSGYTEIVFNHETGEVFVSLQQN